MAHDTAIEKRDRAMIVLTAITGVRDGALISLKLKHCDTDKTLLSQNPLQKVKTKNSKRVLPSSPASHNATIFRVKVTF